MDQMAKAGQSLDNSESNVNRVKLEWPGADDSDKAEGYGPANDEMNSPQRRISMKDIIHKNIKSKTISKFKWLSKHDQVRDD